MSTTTDSKIAESLSDRAWEAIRGGYDLQVHVAPDVIARRTDDVDLAKDFLAHGLKGFVLKSHYIPTAERARVVARGVPGPARDAGNGGDGKRCDARRASIAETDRRRAEATGGSRRHHRTLRHDNTYE